MGRSTFRSYNVDRTTQINNESTIRVIDEFTASPWGSGNLIEVEDPETFGINNPFRIRHGLGRLPRGWVLARFEVRLSPFFTIEVKEWSSDPSDENFLVLYPNQNESISKLSVWVF